VESVYAFSPRVRHATLRHIALWTARDNLPGAYELLTGLPPEAQDEEVMRWRARVSLRAERWTDLLSDIAMMSAEERDSEQWRYWRGIALARGGRDGPARAMLEPLAAERSYYGFLAADELGLPYAFAHNTLAADEAVIETLAKRHDLLRARELFLVGLDGRGRSEWDAAIAGLSAAEKTQAAVLAQRWGWYSRAIATAASAGHYDDLALRYPLPFRQSFEQHASAASIPTTWALGIARSESLFMRDVRSRAGAIGLMQLMPATGRQVAREIKLPYSGLDTLTDPNQNIRLGTSYLGSMIARYDGNHVLATAAYNAGPHRVDRWLPQSSVVDARIWIENIPFNETRKYVRRVLAAETIFHWRLTGEMRRLSDSLPQVRPLPADQQLASR
jgi:soluble lytic murein transglycosylase